VSARYTFATVMVLNHELAEMSGFYQRSFLRRQQVLFVVNIPIALGLIKLI
jgi:hypothetical protein